jgi:hypothetical protein
MLLKFQREAESLRLHPCKWEEGRLGVVVLTVENASRTEFSFVPSCKLWRKSRAEAEDVDGMWTNPTCRGLQAKMVHFDL